MKAKFLLLVPSALLLFSCTPANSTPINPDDSGEVVASVVSISASGLTKTEYEINEEVSLNGLVVTAYMSDGTSKTVPHSECTFNIPSTSTSGMKNATVTYDGKDDGKFYPVALFQNQLIEISNENGKKVTKLEFYAHDDMTYSKISSSFENLKSLNFQGATKEVKETLKKVIFTYETPVGVASATVSTSGFTLKIVNVYYY